MYFLIRVWGHERRRYAAYKFFIFTQAGGLLLLLAILGIYFEHGRAGGGYTFDYRALLDGRPAGGYAAWCLVGFTLAFLVKLPGIPFHTWLPDAHTEAPTAGSVILAGLLLKTGAYGLLRFAAPLFPEAASGLAPAAMVIGVAGIVYGAVLAFAQRDLKRLVAYTSISHMGFVLLGVFTFDELALGGVTLQMLCHGVSTGALFVLVGALGARLHTRDMDRMGGLRDALPRLSAAIMVFAMASLGLPGLGNFVGEFLTLAGTFREAAWAASLATTGLVFATVYSLWIIQRTLHGRRPASSSLSAGDLSPRETAVTAAMVVVIVALGLFPQPVLRTARSALRQVARQGAEMGFLREPPGGSSRGPREALEAMALLRGAAADGRRGGEPDGPQDREPRGEPRRGGSP
jgi:NADH-quinone oxidoreductase subunit M